MGRKIIPGFMAIVLLASFVAPAAAAGPMENYTTVETAPPAAGAGPGDEAEPMEDYSAVGAEDEAAAKSNYYLGLVELNHKKYEKAERLLQEALRLNPGSYNVRLYLAKTYNYLGKQDKAAALYEEAIQVRKRDPRGYNGLMNYYLDVNEPLKAAKIGETALENGVSPGNIADLTGWSYYRAGDMDNAFKHLYTSARLAKTDTIPINNLGLVYFTRGEYRAALENFLESAHLNKESKVANYFAALAYKKLGDEERALESLKAALKNDPSIRERAADLKAKFFPYCDPGDLSALFDKIEDEQRGTGDK